MFEKLFKYDMSAFLESRLTFLSRIPVEVWVLILIGLGMIAWHLYRQTGSRIDDKHRRLLLGLRLAALAILVLMLAVPALQVRDTKQANVFLAVMLDTSRSMSIGDAGSGRTRIQAAKATLLGADGLGNTGLLAEMSDRVNLLSYGFNATPKRLGGVTDIKADGAYTNIFRSIREVEAELGNVPLAGVVMLTDGCRNQGGRPLEAAKLLEARGVPLYIVGIGDANPPRDKEIIRVFAPNRARRNTEVEVHATIRHTGFTKPFPLYIKRGETTLASMEVKPVKGLDLQRIRISFTPDHDGSATYRIEVPAVQGELIKENNHREFVLDIRDDRLPVLYIEGSPRKEYRFLRRAIFRDHDFRLVGMLRLAKNRFYVQGANNEEKYLRKGFPTTKEQLFKFQAIILGDIEASYFTGKQLSMLEEFVRVRGGGMLMLGGVNSFGPGKYAGTPVNKALPVKISNRDPSYSDERYDTRITADALKHPVMRLLPDTDRNRSYWKTAPPLVGLTPTGGVKTGAQMLIVHEKSKRPVLAVHNYGQGRVAAFTSGGSWYWQMSKQASDNFHEKFWKQLVRWLVVGAKERLSASTDSDVYAPHEAVYVQAEVFGKDLRPVNDAEITATVTDPLGNVEELPMDWILSQEGVYQCRTVPTDEGEYKVSVRVAGWKDKPATTGFHVSTPFVEFIDAGQHEEMLKEMAKVTGGGYFTPDQQSELQAALREAIAATATAVVKPKKQEIWDMPLLYGLVLIILCIEWYVRRRNGLA